MAKKTGPAGARPARARTPGGTAAPGNGGRAAAARAAIPRTGPFSPNSRRHDILALAADLFAERGYRATTVRDIAEGAGMLSGSLYHHFDSKESMVDELLSNFLGDLLARFRAVVHRRLPPQVAIERMVEEAFDALPRHRAAIVVFQHDADYLAKFERFRYLETAADELEDLWVDVLIEGGRTGQLVVEDPALTYRFIRDAIWMSVHWYRLDGPLTTRDLSRIFLRNLLDGLTPRP